MGSVSFIVPHGSPETEATYRAATLAGGYDLAPTPTRREFTAGLLKLTKDSGESGYVLVPWGMDDGRVESCLTATLRERPQPYHLLVELARGKVNQLRCQVAEWEAIGLTLEEAEEREIRDLIKVFGRAVRGPLDPDADRLAGEALNRASRAGEKLCLAFAEQLLQTRLGEGGPLETRLGCVLSALPPPEERAAFVGNFTSVKLVPDWATILAGEGGYDWSALDGLVHWAFAAGLDVTIGPVIDLTDSRFPPGFQARSGDRGDLAATLCEYVDAITRRYQDRVRSWHVCSGFNHRDAFSLGEDDRLRLAARLYEAARNADPDGSWILGIAQPWGDYLTDEDNTYSPLVFADTLVRAGFTFVAVELEVFTGSGHRASIARDTIALYKLVELFGLLSLPLEVTFGGSRDAARPDDTQLVARTSLAVALPQVRAVHCDFSTADSPRDGGLIPEAYRKLVRDFRIRYLA